MKTAAEMAPVINATIRQIESWVTRHDLNTKYSQPERGHPRLYTRDNALELAFIAAVASGGGTPAHAVTFAKTFLRSVERVNREWFVFAAGKRSSALATDAPDLAKLHDEFGSLTLIVVRMGELKRRIEKLFEA